MSQVSGKAEGENYTIALSGKVDTTNAAEIEKQIQELRNANPNGKLTLDAADLEYISSAGLRVILRLSQAEDDLSMINVSSDVYEVLEMTGFSEMIHVSKAYRVISVEGCEAIGQGSNGKVYRLDPETIIKVYNNPDALPEINRERDLARKAFVKGIPTAIPYDVVKVEGGGYGSVFELLSAKSFSKMLVANPADMDQLVGLYVDLLKKIHSTDVEPDEMPDMKETALHWADYLKDYLPADEFAKLHSLIEAVPDTNKMIHGDFHTKNVMMQKGEVLLIDMDTLSHGYPIFEFASMYLGFVGFGEEDHTQTEAFIGLPYDLATQFFHKAMTLYLGNPGEEKVQEVVDKARIIGYTRLMRRTIKRLGKDTPEGKPIVERCEKHLHELLGRVDTLTF